MEDPDFSVSLVKLNAANQGEDANELENPNSSGWIGSARDCCTLWDSLRKQGQLFRVLDTLTAKTARLVGRIQNQTATEEENVTVVELLSQLGIMFIDEDTKEDGDKEKRFTFVTDVESTLQRQPPIAHAITTQPVTETVPPEPCQPLHTTEAGDDSENDCADTFEPVTVNCIADKVLTDDSPPPTAYVCEWCEKDQGTPVMLDLHLLQYCEVLMETTDPPASCPNCTKSFRQLVRFHNHLLVHHGMETVEAMKIMHESMDRRSKQLEEEEAPKSAVESDCSSESDVAVTPPKTQMGCEVCQDKFGTRIDLRSHLMKAHDFSRQRAVGSVCESVRLAQSQTPIRPESDDSKKPQKGSGHLFRCPECALGRKDRPALIKHMKSAHDMPQTKAQKEVNKQYKEINATFACDLCPRRYSNRYVFAKHLVENHKISKTQSQSKLLKMYPLKRKKGTGRLKKTKSREKDEDTEVEEVASDQQPQRFLRKTRKRARKQKTPERISRRLAQREKEKVQSNEDREDERGNRDNSDVADDDDHQDKESNISNAEEEGENSQEDEAWVPSESGEEDNGSIQKKTVGQDLDPKSDSDIRENVKQDKGLGNLGDERPKISEKPPKKKVGRKPGSKSNAENKHQCPHCDKSFLHLNYAKVHISTCHNEKPTFQCSTCQKPFYFRSTFIRHLTCHKNEAMGINFPCEVCGKNFFDKYALKTHSKIHSNETPFKCDFCDKSFLHQSVLARHRNMHTKETVYKCEQCDRVFYRKGGLKYHVLSVHDKKRDHVCSHCGQGFACRSALIAHENTHSTLRTFQCDICGATVKTKGNLKEHMMCVHTDKRAFKCEICQKTFNRSHRLTLHMMMHRDERPHKCHLCEKGFRTRTNLRVHIKWHQDQRDFQCEQCGKTFLIPGNLDRHMKTHRNGKCRRKNVKKVARTDEGIPNQPQLPVQVEPEVCPTVDNQFHTVQNLVVGDGFESDLPTLASIAQHLSTMNIPVFQVPNTQAQGPIPVAVNRGDNSCTLLPGEASAALAAFGQAHQQLQGQSADAPVVSQGMQGNFEQIELSM